MDHIKSISQIKEIMKDNDLIFHKGLGQNFLFDEHYLSKIVESGSVTKEDTVIEIGPGLGVLTTRLAEKAKKVIAIEIDQNIVPVLENLTRDAGNIEIICADVMKTDLKTLIAKEESVKIVANLPYYITTPIIMKLLEEKLGVECIVVMIQKEVAQRLVATSGTKDYGAITLAVNYYAKPEIMFTVPPGAFVPAPKVDSAVVKMEIREKPLIETDDEKHLFSVIKSAFGQRRKTLVNALSSQMGITKENVIKTLNDCDLNEKIRGEVLTLQQFGEISKKLKKLKG